MGLLAYFSRVKHDYQTVFNTDAGKHVLSDLYAHLHGKDTSMPANADPIQLAFNEGKRYALLHIMARLKRDDTEMRKQYAEHMEERMREEMSE